MDDHQRWKRLLLRTAEVLVQLHVSKCRMDRVTRPGGGSPSTPLVFRVDASESMSRVRDVLQGIAVAWAKDHKSTAVFVKSPVDLVVFIKDRLNWVTKHQLSAFWEEALDSAVREAWKVVDVPQDLVRLGVCGAELAEGQCRAELWHRPDQTQVMCDRCGNLHHVASRQQDDIDRAADEEVPLRIAVRALSDFGMHVTLRQAQGWTERINPATGDPWLVATTVGPSGTRLYRMRDVAAIAENPPRRGRPKAQVS